MDQATDAKLCDSLLGVALPAISLPSTRGGTINLGSLKTPRTVIYCYPRTSEPGKPAPTGLGMRTNMSRDVANPSS